MGWLPTLIALIASALLYDTGHPVLLGLAISATIGCFWSWGIMHNYGTEAAKKRSNYKGSFFDITEGEAQSVPNWVALANMSFSILALIALVSAVVVILN